MFSLAVYFLLSYYVAMPLYTLIFVLLATVFVDIDIKNSRAGKAWFLRPFQWLTRHRGVVHSLIAALVLSLLIGMVNLWAGFGFFVGYIAHLFLDCFTRAGVSLFWPFRFKIKGFVKSGGIIEQVIFVLLLLGDIFVLGKVVFVSLF